MLRYAQNLLPTFARPRLTDAEQELASTAPEAPVDLERMHLAATVPLPPDALLPALPESISPELRPCSPLPPAISPELRPCSPRARVSQDVERPAAKTPPPLDEKALAAAADFAAEDAFFDEKAFEGAANFASEDAFFDEKGSELFAEGIPSYENVINEDIGRWHDIQAALVQQGDTKGASEVARNLLLDGARMHRQLASKTFSQPYLGFNLGFQIGNLVRNITLLAAPQANINVVSGVALTAGPILGLAASWWAARRHPLTPSSGNALREALVDHGIAECSDCAKTIVKRLEQLLRSTPGFRRSLSDRLKQISLAALQGDDVTLTDSQRAKLQWVLDGIANGGSVSTALWNKRVDRQDALAQASADPSTDPATLLKLEADLAATETEILVYLRRVEV